MTRRKEKDKKHTKPPVKEKFIITEETAPEKVPKFTPATENQKLAVAMLRNGVKIQFLIGSAGTGKSMLAAWWAATQYKAKVIDKIYLVRPAVATGKSVGLLPGTEAEKLAPYFAQTLIHLEKFMGKGALEHALAAGNVEMKSGEYLRGRSFEDSIVICEEVQNFTDNDLEMVLTRLGRNCTYLLTGDQKQNDLRGMSGLMSTIDLINKTIDNAPKGLSNEDLDALEDMIGVVQFTPEDCVRDGLTRAFVKMYYYQ